MEKKMIMTIVAAVAIIALGYMVPSAYAESQPPGVQGLWNTGQQQCQYETQATQSQEGAALLDYGSQSAGVQGLWNSECRCDVQLMQPSKWEPWPDYASQPAGIQGMWPSKPQTKC